MTLNITDNCTKIKSQNPEDFIQKISGNQYVCRECGCIQSQKGNLRIHIKSVHLQIKEFACEICGKLFSQSSNRNRHVAYCHDKKPPTELNVYAENRSKTVQVEKGMNVFFLLLIC